MKVSASIELVLQLAGREAIASQFKEIEPEHLLEGTLKFAELPVEQVRKIVPGESAANDLVVEVNALQKELAARTIEGKKIRRSLRAKLGKGDTPYAGGSMHRTQASRAIFDAAAKLADDRNDETLTAKHLLEALLSAPTPMMKEVLGKAVAPQPGKAVESPLLRQWGREVAGAEAKGETSAEWQAECKTLLGAMENRRSVLVVGGSGSVQSVLVAAARALAGGDCPAELKEKRLLDVREACAPKAKLAELLELHDRLLAEAAAAPEVILVCSIEARQLSELQAGTLATLKSKLVAKAIQCIITVDPGVCDRLMATDRTWKRLAHVMWVHAAKQKDVPREL
jgi:ATP-dependent Clp protease ATP-binding subunit ClpA